MLTNSLEYDVASLKSIIPIDIPVIESKKRNYIVRPNPIFFETVNVVLTSLEGKIDKAILITKK